MSPLTMRVPTRVMKPFTLSDFREETTSVEPGRTGARSARLSCRPDFRERSVSWREARSHWSSRAYREG